MHSACFKMQSKDDLFYMPGCSITQKAPGNNGPDIFKNQVIVQKNYVSYAIYPIKNPALRQDFFLFQLQLNS